MLPQMGGKSGLPILTPGPKIVAGPDFARCYFGFMSPKEFQPCGKPRILLFTFGSDDLMTRFFDPPISGVFLFLEYLIRNSEFHLKFLLEWG